MDVIASDNSNNNNTNHSNVESRLEMTRSAKDAFGDSLLQTLSLDSPTRISNSDSASKGRINNKKWGVEKNGNNNNNKRTTMMTTSNTNKDGETTVIAHSCLPMTLLKLGTCTVARRGGDEARKPTRHRRLADVRFLGSRTRTEIVPNETTEALGYGVGNNDNEALGSGGGTNETLGYGEESCSVQQPPQAKRQRRRYQRRNSFVIAETAGRGGPGFSRKAMEFIYGVAPPADTEADGEAAGVVTGEGIATVVSASESDDTVDTVGFAGTSLGGTTLQE